MEETTQKYPTNIPKLYCVGCGSKAQSTGLAKLFVASRKDMSGRVQRGVFLLINSPLEFGSQ